DHADIVIREQARVRLERFRQDRAVAEGVAGLLERELERQRLRPAVAHLQRLEQGGVRREHRGEPTREDLELAPLDRGLPRALLGLGLREETAPRATALLDRDRGERTPSQVGDDVPLRLRRERARDRLPGRVLRLELERGHHASIPSTASQSAIVTRSTSSRLVTPRMKFRSPQRLSVSMPSSSALSLMSWTLARSTTMRLTASVMRNVSSNAKRPR